MNEWMDGVRAVYILTDLLTVCVCVCVCVCARVCVCVRVCMCVLSMTGLLLTPCSLEHGAEPKRQGRRGENCSAGICLNTSELETWYDHAAANIFFM